MMHDTSMMDGWAWFHGHWIYSSLILLALVLIVVFVINQLKK